MNNLERDAAIDDLLKRVAALEGHTHTSDELLEPTDPPTTQPETTEAADVRNENEDSQPGQ